MKSFQTAPLVAAMCLAGSAWAISPSIYVSGSPVINPFTNQATEAWKAVGYLTYPNGIRCSAVQITPEWIVSAKHCGVANNTVFRNAWSNSEEGSALECDTPQTTGQQFHPTQDLAACRLSNPERFSPPPVFPTLLDSHEKLISGRDLGSEMCVGFTGTKNVSLNFASPGIPPGGEGGSVGLMPSSANSFNVDNTPQVFQMIPGDSGGGIFWFPPHSAQALYRVPVSGGRDTDWLLAKIRARGDTLPALANEAEIRRLSGGAIAPPSLPTPPTVRVSTTGITVSWTPPALLQGDQIDDYHLYEGLPKGVPAESFQTGTAASAALSGIGQEQLRRVCVAPRNDGLEAISQGNCTDYDPRMPGMSTVSIKTSGPSALKTVALTWKPARSQNTQRFHVTYSIKLGAGTTRVVKLDTGNWALNVGVPVNAQFCAQVTPFTSWAEGAPATTCQLIK